MPLDSVYRVRLRGHLQGRPVEWGIHIRQATTTGSPADLAGSWVAAIQPAVDAASTTNLNWDDLMIVDTSPTGQESYVHPFTQPHPGLAVGEALPPQDAVLFRFGTGQKGRRKHGRAYFPGILETSQSGGQLLNPQLGSLEAITQALLNTYGPTGTQTAYDMVIYSPPTPPFKMPTPPPVHTDTVITPVSTVSVNPLIKTQRRRSL